MSGPSSAALPVSRRREQRLIAAVFVLGLVISLVMAMRSQLGGDQLNMLARGWLLAERGTWIPYGLTTSANGKAPGGLTSLLAGLPLMVWRDYRAPTLFVLLAHVVAYLLLDGALRRVLAPRERLLFALLYWLNPWRLVHSAFLWNSNWMFFFGAIHFCTAFGLRRRPSFVISVLHVLVLAAALQTHPAFVILVVASALLVWRGFVRPNWAGVAVGAVLGALALVPWALAMIHHPSLIPGGKGFPLRGLIFVFPLARGVLYWLRYPSLSYGGTMDEFDFSRLLGSTDTILGPALQLLLLVLGVVSVLLPLRANAWMWRSNRHRALLRPGPATSDRVWLHGAVAWTFVGALISYAVSPTTIMMWQGFSIMYASVLTIVLFLGALRRSRYAPRVGWLVRAVPAIFVVVLAAMTFGSPMFRRGGREAATIAVRCDHPMYSDLGVFAHTSVHVDPASPWEPDVFRSDPAQGR
ncbi:MAG: hypothetical protein ACHQQS_12205 [Thermoanaerobaculales bacterium]